MHGEFQSDAKCNYQCTHGSSLVFLIANVHTNLYKEEGRLKPALCDIEIARVLYFTLTIVLPMSFVPSL